MTSLRGLSFMDRKEESQMPNKSLQATAGRPLQLPLVGFACHVHLSRPSGVPELGR